MIGGTIKDTSCSYIKKIQGVSRGKVNVFGADITVTFLKKSPYEHVSYFGKVTEIPV